MMPMSRKPRKAAANMPPKMRSVLEPLSEPLKFSKDRLPRIDERLAFFMVVEM
jgi:hypothetical protein